jgi:hypothetical protein
MTVRHFYLISLAAVLGCASASGGSGVRGGGGNVIAEQELAASNVSNAYEAVERLRPNFLRSRGPSSLRTDVTSLPNVYVGRQKYGDASALRQIPISTITQIRFLTASEAALSYGMDNPNGVIEVTLKST